MTRFLNRLLGMTMVDQELLFQVRSVAGVVYNTGRLPLRVLLLPLW